MSENERIQQLTDILLELHHGASPESVQDRFRDHFGHVSAIEIAMLEQQIIFNPDNPITFEDVLKLCNVHAEIFKDHIDPVVQDDMDQKGHPVRVFKNENRALEAAVGRIQNILASLPELDLVAEPGILRGFLNQLALVGQFERHYQRKERLFFPYMEKAGYQAPPKVMWAKDDEIRTLYKSVMHYAEQLPDSTVIPQLTEAFDAFQEELLGMIFKEEQILLNILLETLTPENWYQIAQESDAYGYTIIPPEATWEPDWTQKKEIPVVEAMPSIAPSVAMTPLMSNKMTVPGGALLIQYESTELVPFDRSQPLSEPFTHGTLSLNQIEWVMAYLPFDIQVFDAHGLLQYESQQNVPRLGTSYQQIHPAFKEAIQTWLHSTEGSMTLSTEPSEYLRLVRLTTSDEQPNPSFAILIEDIQSFAQLSAHSSRELTALDQAIPAEIRSTVVNQTVVTPTLETQQLQFSQGRLTVTFQPEAVQAPEAHQRIDLSGGQLSLDEINALFNALPVEMTVVNSQLEFVYYNEHTDPEAMLFKRTPSQLGRHLEFCHPPAVWGKVNTLIQQLRSKQKGQELMWFTNRAHQCVHVSYIGLYDGHGEFQGILELVRDIRPLQKNQPD